ncbi:hypothetical protein DPMN_156043 [Dreissena polymorpha]|uniref:Uncharacterized protein n=1 Tax=Dreissena polymorpha TaxID=45954 RepID=A0A9D4FUV6_DREPO|nr:hypothetical protein DPMN_156043 [Dreissena polymorpha]
MTSRVFTRFLYNINKTNLFTKFYDDWANNVTSRETNLSTKFHEDWTKNVTSGVLTCIHIPVHFHYLHRAITIPPLGGNVFSPIWIIFKFVQDIYKTNVLTKFHDDWSIIVTSRVFTRKTAPPTGGHTKILTNFELDRDIIWTNLLTKFHEDRTRNVASRVLTTKFGRTDGRRTKTDPKSSPEQSGRLGNNISKAGSDYDTTAVARRNDGDGDYSHIPHPDSTTCARLNGLKDDYEVINGKKIKFSPSDSADYAHVRV